MSVNTNSLQPIYTSILSNEGCGICEDTTQDTGFVVRSGEGKRDSLIEI